MKTLSRLCEFWGFNSYQEDKNTDLCIVGGEGDYYGQLNDVIELEYMNCSKVVLFKCDWFDPVKHRGWKIHYEFGLGDINHKKKLRNYDPFIMAHQAQQVYFISYPSMHRYKNDWWAVCRTKARSTIKENEDVDQLGDEDRRIVLTYQGGSPQAELKNTFSKSEIWSISQRLVTGALVYFIWQERNLRHFQQNKRTFSEQCGIIRDNVRLRSLSLKIKSSRQAKEAAGIWGFSVGSLLFEYDDWNVCHKSNQETLYDVDQKSMAVSLPQDVILFQIITWVPAQQPQPSKRLPTFYTIDCKSPPDDAPCSRPLPQFAAHPPQYMYILTSFHGLRIRTVYYCSCEDDYKLLVVTEPGNAYIYSLKSDSWRKLDTKPPFQKYFLRPGFCLNKNLYFLSHIITDGSMRFDTKAKRFHKIKKPPVPYLPCSTAITVQKGSIHLCAMYGSTCIELWKLIADGDIWRKVVTYQLRPNRDIGGLTPVHLLNNGNLLMIDHKGGGRRICQVDLSKKKYTEDRKDGHKKGKIKSFKGNYHDEYKFLYHSNFSVGCGEEVIYTETFVSPNQYMK
ncbi:zinc finger, CCHC-type containing protein [Tanacetum coccineum]